MITCKCGDKTFKVKKGAVKKASPKKVAATKQGKADMGKVSKASRDATRKALKAANANAAPCNCTGSK